MRYAQIIDKLYNLTHYLWMRHEDCNIYFLPGHSNRYRALVTARRLKGWIPKKAVNIETALLRCDFILREKLKSALPYWEMPKVPWEDGIKKQCRKNGVSLNLITERVVKEDSDW
jgi:hypothetical protein